MWALQAENQFSIFRLKIRRFTTLFSRPFMSAYPGGMKKRMNTPRSKPNR